MITSKLCTAADFTAPWFLPWRASMRYYKANGVALGNSFLHRKEWEFVIVSQALAERNLLQPGKCGIGFAVGREPLPALFAARGCTVLATDHLSDLQGKWQGTWATDRSVLSYPELCPSNIFEQNVVFQHVDMSAIPRDLKGYDFSWSCCAFEHLGDLRRGFAFLENQMHCLKPGGWAIHTTEFNLSSDTHTIESGNTVVYRKQDIQELCQRMNTLGHSVTHVDFVTGDQREDLYVAENPSAAFSERLAHIRLLIRKYMCTSMVLIIRKSMT